MPCSDHFKAWVQVGNAPLPEYMIETDAEGTMRCWVPSEEGRNFELHWQEEVRFPATRATIMVDGQCVRKKVGRSPDGHHSVRAMDGDLDADSAMRSFKFGKVVLTDDDSAVLQDETQVKALGSIEMVINTGTTCPVSQKPRKSKTQAFDTKPVHEKMKKAACHRVVPGEDLGFTRSVVGFRPDDVASARFVFQYSPKDYLQALGIIPRDSTPPPTARASNSQLIKMEQDIDDAGFESDTLDEDDRQLKMLENQMAVIKKRKSETHDSRPAKKLKVEEVETRRFFKRGEVIDLT